MILAAAAGWAVRYCWTEGAPLLINISTVVTLVVVYNGILKVSGDRAAITKAKSFIDL